MNIQEIVDIITYAEKEYAVDEWKIDGISLWPFIRLENYYVLSLLSLNGTAVLESKSSGYFKQILKSKVDHVKAKVQDSKNNSTVKKADVLLISDGMSYTKLNDTWYQKFCDPISDQLNQGKITNLRFDLGHNFIIPRYSPSKFIQSSVDNAIIKSKFMKPKFNDENWGDYESFLTDEKIKNNFAVILDKNQIRNKIGKIKSLIKYYSKIIEKTQAKICYIGCYYGDHQLAFVLACRLLGVATVDVQHGVQGDFHLAYGNWLKVPQQGFDSLPDYFAVWSENEKTAIEKWNTTISKHKVIVTGNQFSEIWKMNNNKMVLSYDEKVRKLAKLASKPLVLLTLSPHTDKETDLIYDVVKQTENEYNWLIRLHPSQMVHQEKIIQRIKDKKISKFDLIQSSSLPLYAILRNVDIHITVQSTCVIEATTFGIPSIITTDYGKNLYLSDVKAGFGFHCESTEEIKTKLNQLSTSKLNPAKDSETEKIDIVEFTKSILAIN